jgi:hypothetical protein
VLRVPAKCFRGGVAVERDAACRRPGFLTFPRAPRVALPIDLSEGGDPPARSTLTDGLTARDCGWRDDFAVFSPIDPGERLSLRRGHRIADSEALRRSTSPRERRASRGPPRRESRKRE